MQRELAQREEDEDPLRQRPRFVAAGYIRMSDVAVSVLLVTPHSVPKTRPSSGYATPIGMQYFHQRRGNPRERTTRAIVAIDVLLPDLAPPELDLCASLKLVLDKHIEIQHARVRWVWCGRPSSPLAICVPAHEMAP